MSELKFFKNLELQFAKKLPFVVYSRPINRIIKYWLQEDSKLYETFDFSESGFVFAPFNLEDDIILFPENKCKHDKIEIDKLDITISEKELTEGDSVLEKEHHLKLVETGISAIKKGKLDKIVLSRFEFEDANVNPIEIFKRLFNTYINAMVYCWYHPKVGLWIGATPELLFKVEGKQLTTISLAGTQPYQDNIQPNWTDKELKEQQIVTDYLVSQVSPYVGNTTISEVETIQAGRLWHLKSRLISRLKDNTSLKSIIEALHPTPAVCGFPKQKAKEFILQNENYKREYYTGFLGELNLKFLKSRNANRRNIENDAYSIVKKQSNFYVNLRCAQIIDSKAKIYVGGGILKDSNPEKEWQETINKTKTIRNILG